MKKIANTLIIAVLLAVVSPADFTLAQVLVPDEPTLARGGGSPEFSVLPSFTAGFGKTEYELELSYFATDNNGQPIVWTIRSLLEFPLDIFYGGMEFRFESPASARYYWYARAGVHIPLTDPDNAMIDSDWNKVTGLFDEKFSYTESKAVMSGFLADLELGRQVGGDKRRVSFAVTASVKYQRAVQNIDNFVGWQKPFDTLTFTHGDPFSFSVEDTPSLYYKVTYFMPGLGMAVTAGDVSRSHARFAVAGHAVFARDVDDHILRKKISDGKGTGRGLTASAAFHLLPRIGHSNSFFLEIKGDLTTLSVKGSQTQTWYGDDAATPNYDDTGESIAGIPHDFRSSQYSLRLSIGKKL